MVFSFLKKAVDTTVKDYSGNKDFLEAAASAAAIVAASDGTIEDDEIVAAIEAIQSIPALSKAYTTSQIEEECQKRMKQAKTLMGRTQLKRELEDVAKKDIQLRQDVILTAAQAADAVGGIGDKETAALTSLGTLLNVNTRDLLAA